MTALFWFALIVGGGLLLTSVAADAFDADIPGFGDAEADLDLETDLSGLKLLSLRNLTYFLFAFGAVGVGLGWLWGGEHALVTLAAALVAGGLSAAFTATLFGYLHRTESGGTEGDAVFVGLPARVVIPVSEAGGRVLVERGGRRIELLARPFDGETAGSEGWTDVVVIDMREGTALVGPLDAGLAPEPES